MKKGEIIIDPNKPLPPALSKEWEETFAKLILEHYFPKTFSGLSTSGECPDLRNVDAGVGVEVTNAESEEARNLDSIYSRDYIHGDDSEKQRALKKIQKLHGKVNDACLCHPIRDRSLAGIYKAVKRKTEKLNRNYEVFAKNYLFIFTVELLDNEELPGMLRKIVDSADSQKEHFVGVFVRCLGDCLLEFDLEHMKVRRTNTKSSDISLLSIRAREIVEEKHSSSSKV